MGRRNEISHDYDRMFQILFFFSSLVFITCEWVHQHEYNTTSFPIELVIKHLQMTSLCKS